MKPIETIYVALPEESVAVWRPINAVRLHDNVFLIVEQEYDREVETWQFVPGDVVQCEIIQTYEGQILAAVSRLERSDSIEGPVR